MGRGQWGGLGWEGAMGRGRCRVGQRERGDGEGVTGRKRWGRGQREGGEREREKKGQEERDFTDGYDEISGWTYGMLGWNVVTEFSNFVYPYPS